MFHPHSSKGKFGFAGQIVGITRGVVLVEVVVGGGGGLSIKNKFDSQITIDLIKGQKLTFSVPHTKALKRSLSQFP